MIKDFARRLLGFSSVATHGEALWDRRSATRGALATNAPSASSRTSIDPGDFSGAGSLLSSEKLSEKLDSVRVALGSLMREPRAALLSSQNIELVHSIKAELETISQGVNRLEGAALWSGRAEGQPSSDSTAGHAAGALEGDGVTIFHERERTVMHSPKGTEQFTRGTSHATCLTLSDGTALTSEMAEQLLLQLEALHAAQHAEPSSLLLLSELTEVRALCRSLTNRIAEIEQAHDQRLREVHEAAATIERQLEVQIEGMRSVMKGLVAVRGGVESV